MASDRRLEFRVSRLENDTAAIYELISDIKSTQDEHSRRFDAIDRRFEAVEATLAEVLRRLPEAS